MSLKSIFQIFKQGRFKIPNEEGVLVFPTDTEVADTPLPDIFFDLPTDVQRVVLSYLRTPSAECIARECFSMRYELLEGEVWENLDGWSVFRRNCSRTRRADRYFQKDYDWYARELAGHLCHRHWKEARERVSKYKYEGDNYLNGHRVTHTQHSAWLRKQLALNNIHPPARTHRRKLWTLFMAL
jgi:hypothetical protein